MRNPIRVHGVIVSIAVVLLGCSKTDATGDLLCQLTAQQKQTCTAVLSLESGVLRLKEAGRFELVAHYDACFQSGDITVSGEYYQQQPHESVLDIELLATSTQMKGQAVERFPRTIGLVTLNNTSLTGRFMDIWAMIRTHTQNVENLPLIAVSCSKDV